MNLTHRSNDGDNEQHDEPGGEDNARPVVSGQKLSNRPGDLYVLWREYALGVNGGKPARDYSPSERGANRYAYSRRKKIWNAICSLTTRDTLPIRQLIRSMKCMGRARV